DAVRETPIVVLVLLVVLVEFLRLDLLRRLRIPDVILPRHAHLTPVFTVQAGSTRRSHISTISSHPTVPATPQVSQRLRRPSVASIAATAIKTGTPHACLIRARRSFCGSLPWAALAAAWTNSGKNTKRRPSI